MQLYWFRKDIHLSAANVSPTPPRHSKMASEEKHDIYLLLLVSAWLNKKLCHIPQPPYNITQFLSNRHLSHGDCTIVGDTGNMAVHAFACLILSLSAPNQSTRLSASDRIYKIRPKRYSTKNGKAKFQPTLHSVKVKHTVYLNWGRTEDCRQSSTEYPRTCVEWWYA